MFFLIKKVISLLEEEKKSLIGACIYLKQEVLKIAPYASLKFEIVGSVANGAVWHDDVDVHVYVVFLKDTKQQQVESRVSDLLRSKIVNYAGGQPFYIGNLTGFPNIDFGVVVIVGDESETVIKNFRELSQYGCRLFGRVFPFYIGEPGEPNVEYKTPFSYPSDREYQLLRGHDIVIVATQVTPEIQVLNRSAKGMLPFIVSKKKLVWDGFTTKKYNLYVERIKANKELPEEIKPRLLRRLAVVALGIIKNSPSDIDLEGIKQIIDKKRLEVLPKESLEQSVEILFKENLERLHGFMCSVGEDGGLSTEKKKMYLEMALLRVIDFLDIWYVRQKGGKVRNLSKKLVLLLDYIRKVNEGSREVRWPTVGVIFDLLKKCDMSESSLRKTTRQLMSHIMKAVLDNTADDRVQQVSILCNEEQQDVSFLMLKLRIATNTSSFFKESNTLMRFCLSLEGDFGNQTRLLSGLTLFLNDVAKPHLDSTDDSAEKRKFMLTYLKCLSVLDYPEDKRLGHGVDYVSGLKSQECVLAFLEELKESHFRLPEAVYCKTVKKLNDREFFVKIPGKNTVLREMIQRRHTGDIRIAIIDQVIDFFLGQGVRGHLEGIMGEPLGCFFSQGNLFCKEMEAVLGARSVAVKMLRLQCEIHVGKAQGLPQDDFDRLKGLDEEKQEMVCALVSDKKSLETESSCVVVQEILDSPGEIISSEMAGFLKRKLIFGYARLNKQLPHDSFHTLVRSQLEVIKSDDELKEMVLTLVKKLERPLSEDIETLIMELDFTPLDRLPFALARTCLLSRFEAVDSSKIASMLAIYKESVANKQMFLSQVFDFMTSKISPEEDGGDVQAGLNSAFEELLSFVNEEGLNKVVLFQYVFDTEHWHCLLGCLEEYPKLKLAFLKKQIQNFSVEEGNLMEPLVVVEKACEMREFNKGRRDVVANFLGRCVNVLKKEDVDPCAKIKGIILSADLLNMLDVPHIFKLLSIFSDDFDFVLLLWAQLNRCFSKKKYSFDQEALVILAQSIPRVVDACDVGVTHVLMQMEENLKQLDEANRNDYFEICIFLEEFGGHYGVGKKGEKLPFFKRVYHRLEGREAPAWMVSYFSKHHFFDTANFLHDKADRLFKEIKLPIDNYFLNTVSQFQELKGNRLKMRQIACAYKCRVFLNEKERDPSYADRKLDSLLKTLTFENFAKWTEPFFPEDLVCLGIVGLNKHYNWGLCHSLIASGFIKTIKHEDFVEKHEFLLEMIMTQPLGMEPPLVSLNRLGVLLALKRELECKLTEYRGIHLKQLKSAHDPKVFKIFRSFQEMIANVTRKIGTFSKPDFCQELMIKLHEGGFSTEYFDINSWFDKHLATLELNTFAIGNAIPNFSLELCFIVRYIHDSLWLSDLDKYQIMSVFVFCLSDLELNLIKLLEKEVTFFPLDSDVEMSKFWEDLLRSEKFIHTPQFMRTVSEYRRIYGKGVPIHTFGDWINQIKAHHIKGKEDMAEGLKRILSELSALN